MNSNIENSVVQLEGAIKDLTNLRVNHNKIVEDATKLYIEWKIPFKFNGRRERLAVRYHEELDSDRRFLITEENFKIYFF